MIMVCNMKKISKRFNHSLGFTIIELMFSVLILGILTAVAVPNFSDFIEKQKVNSDSSSLAKTLSFARSEAIVARSGSVVVRWNTTSSDITINDTSTATPTPQTLSPGFVAVMDSMTNEFLKLTEYQGSGSNSVDNDADDTITFDSLGRLGPNGGVNTVAMLFCSERGGDKHARRIEVSQTGRVSQRLKDDAGVTSLACPTI